jgi:hypothetical protein
VIAGERIMLVLASFVALCTGLANPLRMLFFGDFMNDVGSTVTTDGGGSFDADSVMPMVIAMATIGARSRRTCFHADEAAAAASAAAAAAAAAAASARARICYCRHRMRCMRASLTARARDAGSVVWLNTWFFYTVFEVVMERQVARYKKEYLRAIIRQV